MLRVIVWSQFVANASFDFCNAAQQTKSNSKGRPIPLQPLDKSSIERNERDKRPAANVPPRRERPTTQPIYERKKSTPDDLSTFVEKKEKDVLKVRAEMFRAIEETRTKIKNSNVSEERKSLQLIHVERESERCRSGAEFPDCAELLDVAVACLEGNHRILKDIQLRREKFPNETFSEQDKEAQKRLGKLERRIEKIFGGPPIPLDKSRWAGNAFTNEVKPLAWGFTIRKIEDAHFTGILREKAEPSEMFGSQEGHFVKLQTTGKAFALKQFVVMDGFRIGKRYLGRIKGMSRSGTQVSGCFDLSKTADAD